MCSIHRILYASATLLAACLFFRPLFSRFFRNQIDCTQMAYNRAKIGDPRSMGARKIHTCYHMSLWAASPNFVRWCKCQKLKFDKVNHDIQMTLTRKLSQPNHGSWSLSSHRKDNESFLGFLAFFEIETEIFTSCVHVSRRLNDFWK